jgi:hypothetical protein
MSLPDRSWIFHERICSLNQDLFDSQPFYGERNHPTHELTHELVLQICFNQKQKQKELTKFVPTHFPEFPTA